MSEQIKLASIIALIFTILIILYITMRNTNNTAIDDLTQQQSEKANQIAEIARKKELRRYNRLLLISCVKTQYYVTKWIEIAESAHMKEIQRNKTCYKSPGIRRKSSGVQGSKRLYKSMMESVRSHKNGHDSDDRGIGVVWCVVGLLILSLIASIIDVMNAKKPQFKKMSSFDLAGKPAAAPRRCSLASLTAARHTRRQQFVSKRPASIAETPSPTTILSSSSTSMQSLASGSQPQQQPAAGKRDSSATRRSSSPGIPDGMLLSIRRESVAGMFLDSEEDSSSPDRLHKRVRLIRRF